MRCTLHLIKIFRLYNASITSFVKKKKKNNDTSISLLIYSAFPQPPSSHCPKKFS